jgi:hypothetical protein
VGGCCIVAQLAVVLQIEGSGYLVVMSPNAEDMNYDLRCVLEKDTVAGRSIEWAALVT